MSTPRTCVFNTVLYACEAWTIKKTDRDKILAFEMYCYRRILHISWTQKVSNNDVRKQLKIKENLMQAVVRRKLDLFEHMCRTDKTNDKVGHDGNNGRSNKEGKTL